MFFKKLKKEIVFANLFNMIVLLVLFFVFKNQNNFVPEQYSLFFPLSKISSITPLLIPISLIFYFYIGAVIISALNRLNGKFSELDDYKFYLISSVVYLILYAIIMTVVVFLVNWIVDFSLAHALSDSPMVFWIVVVISIGGTIIKLLTYVKICSRINYFKEKRNLSFKVYFSGFKMLTNIKPLLLFFLIAFSFVAIPYCLIAYAIYSVSVIFTILSLLVGLVSFATGKLYLYYVLSGIIDNVQTKNEKKKLIKRVRKPKKVAKRPETKEIGNDNELK